MRFYFHPVLESKFKEEAVGKFVRTIVFNELTNEIETSFIRSVQKIWTQSCKNNIETDHRIKALKGSHFKVYSWIVPNKNNFDLPSFQEFSNT